MNYNAKNFYFNTYFIFLFMKEHSGVFFNVHDPHTRIQIAVGLLDSFCNEVLKKVTPIASHTDLCGLPTTSSRLKFTLCFKDAELQTIGTNNSRYNQLTDLNDLKATWLL